MQLINKRNCNDALTAALELMDNIGVPESSRNGPVMRLPTALATVFSHPSETQLFAPWRDANPFFNAAEACWMLAGRNDLKQLTPYIKKMAEFSDDGGVTQPAAYGKRWRDWFSDIGDEGGTFPSLDQLNWVVKRLRINSNDRRAVISMWDASSDPHQADANSKDVPCNLLVLPSVIDGRLYMMTVSRSHDLIWGAYGANASHFGVLQQYLAARLGLGVGTYTMISNNAHMYLETMPPRKLGQPRVLSHPSHNLYADGKVNVFPIFSGWENEDDYRREINLQQDLAMLFEYPLQETQLKARWPWLRQVVCPMLLAHQHWRQGRGEDRYTGALEILSQVKASDWSQAGEQWLQRRYDKWKRAADDGALHDD